MKLNRINIHQTGNLTLAEFETGDMAALNVYPAGHYIEKGLCRVIEQKEEQVGNVLIINESDDYLLFTDMDILVGAKQNRVVNISTLVRPRTKSNLEVSCIEQNRWDHSFQALESCKKVIEPDMRSRKIETIALRLETKKYRSELQDKLWSAIRARIGDNETTNPTSNYALYLHEKENTGNSNHAHHLQPDIHCNGIALFRDEKLSSIEIFGNTALYQYYFRKITEHFLTRVKTRKKDSLSEPVIKEMIQKEIGICKFFKPLPGKNGVGKLRIMHGDERKGFELSEDEERVHELILLDREIAT